MRLVFTSAILGLFLLTGAPVKAQWTPVYQNPNIRVGEIQFTSNQVGYAIGTKIDTSQVVLLKTVDGGTSWNEIGLDISFGNNIEFIDDNKGYVIKGGAPGRILYSTDGFNTWTGHDLADGSFEAMDIHATSDSTGFFILNEGRLEEFAQYGATSTVNTNLTQFFRFAPVSKTECYVISPMELHRTTDGGNSWNMVAGFYSMNIDAVFTSSDTGYFISGGALTGLRTIAKTMDGGLSFPVGYNFPAQHITALGKTVVAVNDTGNIVWSADAGNTWTYETTGTIPLMQCNLALTPDRHCFMTNFDEGAIYKRSTLPLAVKELAADISINCYPNPAGSFISLHSEKQQLTDYEVMDVAGRIMCSGRIKETAPKLDIGFLEPGTYFIKAIAANGSNRVIRFQKL